MADTLTRFRVHFEDGEKVDVTAADTPAANKKALKQHVGIIRKTKIIREELAHG
ncbi:hypothetical protein MRS76_20545 [Rhizobiaceae bacterium n13]|uniref:hypothetical protein n=1 Tax=Ferirhizobium litorale TaxID=2927786 RepID=UPI0024B2EE6E|nr:hypothetical protein [Fererhizobium litorale]MDI7864332.1 hypothetical protein [Fererhizobium litorale]